MTVTLNAPRKTHYLIAQQYTSEASVSTPIRPYQAKGPLRQEIELFIEHAALPESEHYRVELTLALRTVGADDKLHQMARVRLEAIAIASAGLTPEELIQTLKVSVGGALLGSARTLITSLTANTGYGPTVLPPVFSQQLLGAPSQVATPGQ